MHDEALEPYRGSQERCRDLAHCLDLVWNHFKCKNAVSSPACGGRQKAVDESGAAVSTCQTLAFHREDGRVSARLQPQFMSRCSILLLATAHAFAPTTRCAVSGLASSASPLRLRPAV